MPADPTSAVHSLVSRLRAVVRSACAADTVRDPHSRPRLPARAGPGRCGLGTVRSARGGARARLDEVPLRCRGTARPGDGAVARAGVCRVRRRGVRQHRVAPGPIDRGHLGFVDRIAALVDWRPFGRTARIGVPSCTTSSRPLRPSALTYAGARSGNGDQVRLPAGGKCRIRVSSSHTGPLAAMPDGFRPANLIAAPDGGRSSVERAEPRDTGGDRTSRYTSDPARAAGSPRDAAISCRRGRWPAAGSTDGVRGDWASCSPRIRPDSTTFSRCSGRC